MLKYQITGEMIRAKMDDLLGESLERSYGNYFPDRFRSVKRKELYEEAYNILKEEMEKQKAEDQNYD